MKTLFNLKRVVSLLILATSFACCSVGRANITEVTDWNWSSGINCYGMLLDSTPQFVVGATQYNAGPVRMWGTIHTDTVSDPVLTINDQINNQSGIDWSGFVLDVYMSTNFTFSGSPTYPTVANPAGWTSAITIAPSYIGGGQYMGQITFTGGTPVSANPISSDNLLNFTYQVTFSGSLSYSFAEQATAIPVPEPALPAYLLLGLGALLCTWRLKQDKWT